MLQFDLQFYEELTVARDQNCQIYQRSIFLADRSACLLIIYLSVIIDREVLFIVIEPVAGFMCVFTTFSSFSRYSKI